MLNTSGLQLSRKNAGFRTLGAFSAFANSNLSETMASYALNYVPSGPPSTIAVDNAGDGTVAWHLNRGADNYCFASSTLSGNVISTGCLATMDGIPSARKRKRT